MSLPNASRWPIRASLRAVGARKVICPQFLRGRSIAEYHCVSEDQNRPANLEATDALKVNEAEKLLKKGSLDAAQDLLWEVIRNTPSAYVYEYEDDGALCIKFWYLQEFAHYVIWHKNQGMNCDVKWILSAYPRAFYNLGFIHVQMGQPERAMAFLEQGQALEPTNCTIRLEKAHVLLKLQRFGEALKLFGELKVLDRYVDPDALARACRGRGFTLIEMGDLESAEAALKESLQYEPGNETALNELRYIARLRSGGKVIGKDRWRSHVPDTSQKCASCGGLFDSGEVSEIGGRMIAVCKRCIKRDTPWWQFWKKR